MDVRITIDACMAPAGVIKDLADLVDRFPGESDLYLSIDTSEGEKTYRLGKKVNANVEFYLAAREILGEDLQIGFG